MTGAGVDHWIRALREHGYCIIPNLLEPHRVAALEADLEPAFAQTPFGEGYFYGYRTKRFGSLLRRSAHTEHLVLDATILAIVQEILGPACDRVQLNVAQAIEIHPGELEQFPHCDHDMWPAPKAGHEYLVNVIWPLTPFTRSNGATRIYPGTHRGAPASIADLTDPVFAECTPGSAICFLGSTVHGAGANRTQAVRRGVVIGYSLGWLKPYENPWLAYPPEVARNFSNELAELAGYAQHRPNLGNYEGQCPSILLGEEVPAHPGAVDALRPDQSAMVADFAQAYRTRT